MRSLFFYFVLVMATSFAPAKNTDGIEITLQNDKTFDCIKDSSVLGYLCRNGRESLIIKGNFENSFYIVWAKLNNYDPSTGLNESMIKRVESHDGRVLFERAKADIKSADICPGCGLLPPRKQIDIAMFKKRSLAQIYNDANFMKKSLERFVSDNLATGTSKVFSEFIKKEKAQLEEKMKTMEPMVTRKEYSISLSNGEQLTCRRGDRRKTKKRNDRSGARQGYRPHKNCNIFRCGANKKGHETALFFSATEGEAFSRIAYFDKDGLHDGAKVTSISSDGTSVYVPDYDEKGMMERGFYGDSSWEGYPLLQRWSYGEPHTFLPAITWPCQNEVWSDFYRALKVEQGKEVNKELIQYVEMVNGNLQSRLIPMDTLPDDACSENGVFYHRNSYGDASGANPTSDFKTISPETAQALFDDAKSMDDLAWGYYEDGCYARAHLLAKRFEDQGVYVEKAWLAGNLAYQKDDGRFVDWVFHVAPVVYVDRGGGKFEKMVIDPSTFDRPVSVEQWSEKISKSARVVETSFPNPDMDHPITSLSFSNTTPYAIFAPTPRTEKAKLDEAILTLNHYSRYLEGLKK